jgi:hypothetical protein
MGVYEYNPGENFRDFSGNFSNGLENEWGDVL